MCGQGTEGGGAEDSKQMVQSRSKSKLDSWQPAWTASQWTLSFWKATRRLDRRAGAAQQLRDKDSNCPPGSRLPAGQEERTEAALGSTQLLGIGPGGPAKTLNLTCSNAATG